jgi:hypothetical protein
MKAAYRTYCEDDNTISVFMQPWFLDIVTEDNWDIVLSFGKDGNIHGAWPYLLTKKKGLTFIQMPPYTQLLGPTVFFPDHVTTNYKRNSFYQKVIQDLESQLPSYDYLNINFKAEGESWFPLYPLGYKQSTRYTYVIYSGQSSEALSRNLKPQLRNTLNSTTALGEIEIANQVSSFLTLLEESFSGNEIGEFFYLEIIKSLISEAIERNQGTIYTFPGMPAGIFILKDDLKHYCLFTATTEKGKSEEAVAHLIWRAIKDAMDEGKDFDFEGSMLPGVENFFRSFGGLQQGYHQITKVNNPLLRLYKFLKP